MSGWDAYDRTPVLVSPLVLSVEVLLTTILQVNGDGWYEPNPITYSARIANISNQTIKGSIFLDVDAPGSGRPQGFLAGIPAGPTGQHWGCSPDHCQERIDDWFVAAHEVQTVTWQVWLRPMASTILSGTACFSWGQPESCVTASAPPVEVPTAAIHPVIVVPGFMGTFFGLLEPFYHTYSPLLKYLEQIGYQPGVSLFEFPYDWQESVAVTAGLLEDRIGEITGTRGPAYVDYSRVDIVAHSMGGLVARAYLESDPDHGSNVGKLVTLATPHQGSPLSYRAWEGGDVRWMKDLVRLWLGLYACRCWDCAPIQVFDCVHDHVLSVRDMLPPADVPVPYLISATTQEPYPYGRPENVFLEDLNRSDDPSGTYDPGRLLDDGLTIWAVYSLKSPEDTILQIKVRDCFTPTDPLCDSATAPLWLNGIEVERVHGKSDLSCRDDPNCNGDSVVPGYSARLDTIPELAGLAETVRREDFLHANIPKESAVMEWLVWVLTGVAPPDPGKWPGICARWPEVCR